ncbi:MAG: ABC transporter permease [Gemmatimonadota bacterium]|nr:MAG: ABC transporter permease [Gemmatimonadota bacterium]
MKKVPPARGERIYALLLRIYPKRFRQRFASQMLEVFREQRLDAKYAGLFGNLLFWWDMMWDLLVALPGVRRRYSRVTIWEVSVDGMLRDLKFALRTLVRAPGFTVMAVLTLAIGIGSTAAIFGVVNSVLLKPLPYGDSDEVVTVWSSWVGFPKTWVSVSEYRAWLNNAPSFDDLSLYFGTSANFSSTDNPERVDAVGTTENLMKVLQTPMAQGRFFTREEALRADTLPSEVIVISHQAWARRYGNDPGIVGQSVEVNGRARVVVGVLPADFRLPVDFGTANVPDIYFPVWIDRSDVVSFPNGGGSHGSFVVGRLRPGSTVESAKRDLDNIVARLEAEQGAYPVERNFEPFVFSAKDDILGTIRPALLALLGTVVFVLLIACANVANLLLTRSQGRHGEIAVRAALGAGRWRIARQMLTESMLLATIGGGLGIALAYVSIEIFKGLNPGDLPRIDEVSLDGAVLGFSALVTVLTAILFGSLPALRTGRGDLRANLGRRGGMGVGKSGWQGTLVALEMALAVVLVMGAGLMVRTFEQLSSIDVGFQGESLLTMAVSLPGATYPTGQDVVSFHREAMRRMDEIPGVQIATAVRILPLDSQIGDWGLTVEGYVPAQNEEVSGDWQFAAPGYFEAMGIPVSRGRPFEWTDDESGALVGVVNEAFVRRYWPNEDPIGHRFRMGSTGAETWISVVGVVGDVTHNGLTAEIKRKFYIPLAQWESASGGNQPTSVRFVVKATGDVLALTGPVRNVIREMDPSLAIAQIQTVDEIKAAAVAQPRFTVVLMGAFSLVAILLALIGIYGVISYGVSQRTQEIGVRMALGAEPEQVVSLMAKRGITMVMVGLGIGVVIALGLTRFIESLLYNVDAQDPVVFGSVGVGFAVVAWLATYIPARKAAGVNPIQALNSES